MTPASATSPSVLEAVARAIAMGMEFVVWDALLERPEDCKPDGTAFCKYDFRLAARAAIEALAANVSDEMVKAALADNVFWNKSHPTWTATMRSALPAAIRAALTAPAARAGASSQAEMDG